MNLKSTSVWWSQSQSRQCGAVASGTLGQVAEAEQLKINQICSRAAHCPTEAEETRKWHLGSVPPLCACASVCRVSKQIWSQQWAGVERACCSPQREISCSLSTAAAAELQHVAGAGTTMPGTDTTEREKFKVSIVSDIFPDNVSLNTIEHYVLHSPAATARPGVASSFQWLS